MPMHNVVSVDVLECYQIAHKLIKQSEKFVVNKRSSLTGTQQSVAAPKRKNLK